MQTGDIITLGTYPQTADGGAQPIEWRVLKVEDGRTLLIAEKALEYKKFHEEVKPVEWKDCTLRAWLNDEFARQAFTEEEKARLVPTETFPGVTDTVFCLSRDEARALLEDRRAEPTEYINVHGTYIRCEYARWWLRDNGSTKLLGGVVGHDGMFFGLGVKLLSVAVRPAVWIRGPLSQLR